MFKNCKICGVEFETNNPHSCTCSPTCSIKNAKALNKKWRKDNPDRVREYKKPKIVLCRICGGEVPPTYSAGRNSRKHHHEECIVKEALQAVSEGKGVEDSRIRRAWNTYCYSLKELKEMLK
jgi:hypothetical protein